MLPGIALFEPCRLFPPFTFYLSSARKDVGNDKGLRPRLPARWPFGLEKPVSLSSQFEYDSIAKRRFGPDNGSAVATVAAAVVAKRLVEKGRIHEEIRL